MGLGHCKGAEETWTERGEIRLTVPRRIRFENGGTRRPQEFEKKTCPGKAPGEAWQAMQSAS